jgi:hypothetical protein
MGSLEQAEKQTQRRERMKRRKKLMRVLHAILSGEIDSQKVPIDEYFNVQYSPRGEYVSPRDRSQYNYRYMEIDEMLAGTPNIWR